MRITAMKNMSYHATQDFIKHVGNVIVKIEKEGCEPYLGTLRTEAGKTTIHRIKLTRSSGGVALK